MAKAIDEGLPKLRIEEAAASKQAAIDRGRDKIIGVNLFTVQEEDDVEVLVVDQDEVQRQQLAASPTSSIARHGSRGSGPRRLDLGGPRRGICSPPRLRRPACAARSARSVPHLRQSSPASNRLTVASRAYFHGPWKVRSLRQRPRPQRHVCGRAGRRPRILVAKMGRDGHDRGAKVVASSFADLGFDVDLGPLFSTPAEVARQAVENDVHVVGVSTLAAGHLTSFPASSKPCARAAAPTFWLWPAG